MSTWRFAKRILDQDEKDIWSWSYLEYNLNGRRLTLEEVTIIMHFHHEGLTAQTQYRMFEEMEENAKSGDWNGLSRLPAQRQKVNSFVGVFVKSAMEQPLKNEKQGAHKFMDIKRNLDGYKGRPPYLERSQKEVNLHRKVDGEELRSDQLFLLRRLMADCKRTHDEPMSAGYAKKIWAHRYSDKNYTMTLEQTPPVFKHLADPNHELSMMVDSKSTQYSNKFFGLKAHEMHKAFEEAKATEMQNEGKEYVVGPMDLCVASHLTAESDLMAQVTQSMSGTVLGATASASASASTSVQQRTAEEETSRPGKQGRSKPKGFDNLLNKSTSPEKGANDDDTGKGKGKAKENPKRPHEPSPGYEEKSYRDQMPRPPPPGRGGIGGGSAGRSGYGPAR